jgi:mRNA interferase MazF
VVIRRGDVWWASLPEPVGSEPGYRRPLVIVQANSFNQSRIQTVLGVALTTNLRLAEAPGNLLLTSQQTGLPRDCVANITQIITADRRALTERVSSLPPSLIEKLEAGLRLVLDL